MFGFNSTPKLYKNIDAEEFQALKDGSGSVVLDVRSPGEKREGVIEGYEMLDMSSPDFRSKVEQLDKSLVYLIYCRSGSRSRYACDMMANMGFIGLYNLDGGIGEWNSTYGKTIE
jgi:rhodanese-related sulfurtransferase